MDTNNMDTDNDDLAPPRWEDQPTLLADLAGIDLAAGDSIRPTLAAFDADDPLFLATLRPFRRGEYSDAIIEVGALAMALGARRLALSLAGRAWSTRDPIPPVVPGGADLRQHVLMIHTVDGLADPVEVATTMHPVNVDQEGVARVGPAVVDMPGQGWLVQALPVMVADPAGGGVVTADDLGIQVLHCEALGHRLVWGGGALARVQRAVRKASAANGSQDWMVGDAAWMVGDAA